jgi:predicted DNA-binding protein YlxM (UPF0122 family)
MYKKDSDYALNKRSPNIVCPQADGSRLEITPEDCPGFERWKEFSDENYHAQELHSLRTTRRNISMYDLPDRDSAVEDVLAFDEPQPAQRTMANAMNILECLTETQRRRYLLYTRDGLTMRQIASLEQVDPMAVQHSIEAAKKKICESSSRKLKKGSTNQPKNDA